MAVQLLEMNSVITDCDTGDGSPVDQYVIYTYVAKCSDLAIDAVIFDVETEILDIPWASVSTPWKLITPLDDDSAYYKETFNDDRRVVVQDSFLKISGLSQGKILAANILKDNCCIVLLHILNTGEGLLQGVDKVFYEGEFHAINTQVTASNSSGVLTTGINKAPSSIGLILTSVSKNYSMLVSDTNNLLHI